MSETTAYNGIRTKQINQVNLLSGEACIAYSAPDFFVNDESAFAIKRTNNQVQFFTTGEDYFKDLAKTIGDAKKSIFITGWQVNYDVLLDDKRTLWQCLHQALVSQPELRVYVMPWLSPSNSIGTYDFETMLAIFQLNAGLEAGPRAFCLPAMQHSDMEGLGAGFSHHQKSVVIDNTLGYVGGIDLAYGRRDDNNFSLTSTDRMGNDAYNPNVPKLGWMALDKHVGRNGLIMAALFDLSKPAFGGSSSSKAEVSNSINFILDFFQSPPLDFVQSIQQEVEKWGGVAEQGRRKIAEIKYTLLERAIRRVAKLIKLVINDLQIQPDLKQQLRQWLAEVEKTRGNLGEALRIKSIIFINQWISETEVGQVFGLLLGNTFEMLPTKMLPNLGELASSVLLQLYALLQQQACANQTPYRYLLEHPQPLSSPDNSCLAAEQPRMPWQDVHCSISGPSVYDLSRNFIDRWNSQQAYMEGIAAPQDTALGRQAIESIMTWLNLEAKQEDFKHFLGNKTVINLDIKKPQPQWINAALLPDYPDSKPGAASVQVLRSAGFTMLEKELHGRQQASANLPVLQAGKLPSLIDLKSNGVQVDCKSAMKQAISSAQHFLYIENQFFQSDFDVQSELFSDLTLSGPMATLRDIKTLPQDLVRRVRLVEAFAARDIWQLDWVEIDAIARDAGKERSDFLNNMFAMFSLNAQGLLSHELGEAQEKLHNNIGEALAHRIGLAIDEGRPFHVYMVLPVHPEGLLNDPIIMHQIHLTMQSLVFGKHSLIKRIQRRMALREQRMNNVSPKEAADNIEIRDEHKRPAYEQQDWSRYLTLLNLRTWDELDGRVVTEQIYVHSKLLIADDRVAILGSANINDRSLEGSRDSELAVIVRGRTPIEVALDGKCMARVSKTVHELRIALWKKHFGLSLTKPSKIQPATALTACLTTPAAESTWQAIQAHALDNTINYEAVFDFIPRNISKVQPDITPDMTGFPNGFPASVWPAWAYKDLADLEAGGDFVSPLPYQEQFWQDENKAYAPPEDIYGFICQLPTQWTRGENNNSGFNLTVLAQATEQAPAKNSAFAAHRTPQSELEGSST